MECKSHNITRIMEEQSRMINAVSIMYFAFLFIIYSCKTLVFASWDYDCPVTVNPDIFFSGKKIDFPIPYRALQTIPSKYFKIQSSSIEGAGLGVFSTTFIKKGTWLGEYEGDYVPLNISDTGYAWVVHKDDRPIYHADAGDIRTSNWLRYINCARHVTEQSVKHFECAGRVYYISIRDIPPATELFVYYGPNYASLLGIDVRNYYNKSVDLAKLLQVQKHTYKRNQNHYSKVIP